MVLAGWIDGWAPHSPHLSLFQLNIRWSLVVYSSILRPSRTGIPIDLKPVEQEEAGRLDGELQIRVYSSRLLGRDPSLVLHGGGNTSVKLRETNKFGETQDILYV